MNKQTCFILLANPNICQNVTKNDITCKIGKEIFIAHQIKNILQFHQRSKVIVVSNKESIAEVKNHILNKRVKYIEQSHNDMSNVGSYLNSIVQNLPDTHLAIMNLCMFFDPSMMSKLKIMETAVMINKHKKFESKIGCTLDNNRQVNFVFYDLDNKVCEFLYIHKKDLIKFKNIISNHTNSNMYLFEIMNVLIQHGLSLKGYDVSEDVVHLYDDSKLKKIKRLINKK